VYAATAIGLGILERAAISMSQTKTIYFKNVVDTYRIGCMQFSNNKTRRTRKSAEESAAAPSEGAARVEENAKPRQKRTAEKATESAAAITNHRKATKKADQTIPQTAPAVEPVVARQSGAAPPSIAHRQSTPRIVTHEDIAKLAYSYWASRGYQGGCSVEDWLRAERELRLS